MAGPAVDVINRLGANCVDEVDGDTGSFYVCDNKPIRFLGCCAIDPCKTKQGNCPAKYLRNTTFKASRYSLLTDQDCVSGDAAVRWFTCSGTSPPFMGCCSENPCSTRTGCPAGKLYAAKLSSNPKSAAEFLPSTSTTQSAGPTKTASSAASTSNTQHSGLPTGAIIGIAVAAAVVCLAALGLLGWWCWKKRKSNNNDDYGAAAQQSPAWSPGQAPSMAQSSPYTPQNKGVSAPTSMYAPTSTSPTLYDAHGQPYPSPQSSHGNWRDSSHSGPGKGQQPHSYVPSMMSSQNGEYQYQQAPQELPLEPPRRGLQTNLAELPEQRHGD